MKRAIVYPLILASLFFLALSLAIHPKMNRAVIAQTPIPTGCAVPSFGAMNTVSAPARPVAATTGDLNQDGKLDAVVANYDAGTISIYPGDGAGGFGATVTLAVGIHPIAIAKGDVDGNGKIDLIVTNAGSNSVSTLLNRGGLQFDGAVNLSTGLSPHMTVIGDFNRDGNADLVVANRGSDNISVFPGNGSGGFGPAVTYATGPQPVSIAIHDFNRDGNLDLVVGANRVPNLTILLGDGRGGFRTSPALQLRTELDQSAPDLSIKEIETFEYESIDVIAADLDRDGNPDLIWSLADLDLVQVALGDGQGGFGQPSRIATGRQPGRISLGDVNGDGKFDLALGALGVNSVQVRLGDGAGGFPQKADYPVVSPLAPTSSASPGNGRIYSPAIEVFEYESIDAIIGTDRQVYLDVMEYESIDASRPGDNRVSGEWMNYEGIEDFNGDGRPDLLVVNSRTKTVSVMLNTCVAVQCAGINFAPQTSFPVADGATAIVRGDFNGDDWPDLATANWTTHDLSIFLGNKDGGFQYKKGPSLGAGSDFFVYSLAAGDFNLDGRADLAVASEGQNKVWIFLGNRDGMFSAAPGSPFNVAGGPFSIATGHFDRDAYLDLVIGNRATANLSFFKGNGDGSFAPQNSYPNGKGETRFVAVADFDQDGKSDVVVAAVTPTPSDKDQIVILYGNGNGGIDESKTKRYEVFDRPRSIAVADFNHDGKLDLAVCNEGTDNVYVFMGTVGGFIQRDRSPFATGDFPISIVVGDFDRDGHYDLATANFNSNDVSILKGDGTGFFSKVGSFPAGIQPYGLVKGAFNNDARIDLVTANLSSDNISVLLNTCSYTQAPKIGAIPSSLNFGPVKLTYSRTLTLYLQNSGTADLIVTGVSVNSAVYSIPAISMPLTISRGNAIGFPVQFSPTGTGIVEDYLIINSNDATQLTLKVLLTGSGYCGFVISPPGPPPMTPLGGSGNFTVGGSPSCSYTAASNDSWIAITSGASGSGGQSVGYTVAPNTSASTRTGTIAVSGETVTVIQGGTGGGCATPTFKPAASVGFTPGATSVVTADFNKDGKPDLAVASWDLKAVRILLGNGSGGFTEMAGPSLVSGAGFFAYTLATGDFNGDGSPDLAVANEAANRVQVFRGDGAGAFTEFAGSPLSVGNGPYSLDVADLNNDGKLDLATANRYSNNLSVLLGNGSGGFSPAPGSPFSVAARGLADLRTTIVGDVNLDGKRDLVVAGSDTNNVLVLLGDGTGSYDQIRGTLLSVGNRPKAVAIADLDLDGKPDLAVTNEGDDTVSVFKGDGTGAFGRFPIPPVIPSGTFPTGDFPIALIVRDFNFDGLPDLATANFNSNDVTVLLGSGTGLFSGPFSFGAGTRPFNLVAGDFNLDGKPDLATANLNSADVSILLNDCSGSALTADLSIAKSNGISAVAPGAATSYEIVVTNNGPNAVSGARVLDALPPQIASAAWQCTATSGSGCVTAAGTGNVDTRVNLLVGGKATIALTATIGAAATGSVANTATVSPPVGVTDPVTSNNTATDTDAITARIVRVVGSSGAPGTVVSLPVELDSQGNENAIGFSIAFDPAILGNPQAILGTDAAGASLAVNSSQVASGRYGIGLLLPAGRTFAAGKRQLLILSFTIGAGAPTTMTRIEFVDQPVKREIVDSNAVALPVFYLGGTITVAPGLEGDVAPRPNGDATLSIADWAQIQRFVAGLDVPATGSEFQRADVAPKATKGDGLLTAADVAQGGRYAIGLDAPTAAGGPTSPLSPTAYRFMSLPEAFRLAPGRSVDLISDGIERGATGKVSLEFTSLGAENAISFTLAFDAEQLSYIDYQSGTGANGMSILVNAAQATMGRLSVILALPPGQGMTAGVKQLVSFTFKAREQGNPGTTLLRFVDQPLPCEVADVDAAPVAAGWGALNLNLLRTVVGVSAASYGQAEQAAESIIAAFGRSMATATLSATAIPLPTTLAGTTVKVRDGAGVERLAPLFYVSPTQVNFQIPAGTAIGEATFVVTAGDGTISTGTMKIAAVAPALFTANASGKGVAAALVLRIKPDGAQSYEPVAAFDPMTSQMVAVPIEFGPAADQIFLVLFGTGIRGRSSESAVSALIGADAAPVLYAGAQGDWVGLDQVNLGLSRALAGRGEASVLLAADGKPSNPILLRFK